jgi:hypothetical protein
MKAWRSSALGRLRSEPFGDRLFRLRGFSRRPRLGVGKPALQDLVLGLQGFNVGFEDVQKRRIIRADGRGAGRKCGDDHVASGDPVEPVLLEEGHSVA